MALYIVKPWYKKKGGSVDPDDYFDPVTHIATEANFIAFLAAGGKYDNKSLVGYKVQLGNGANYNNGLWVIADVNHNTDQPNTYDLIPQDCFYSRTFSSSSQYWRSSDVRTYLNSTFYNGFSDNFKSRMSTIIYDSNGSTYNDDKVILPSFTEINGTTGTTSAAFVVEGAAYPIFTDNDSRKKYQVSTTTYSLWWTRSRSTSSGTFVWVVRADGGMDGMGYGGSRYLAPVIRVH